MPEIRVEHLGQSFGAQRVLDDVTFTVRDGELVTLLGPSGCGKTTTLMALAGFQEPDSGTIACGEDVFYDAQARRNVAAERRNLGIVFQSYAIWPHLTVAGNVGFPLRIRRQRKAAIRARVQQVLELVEMGAHADRYPHQLSGGQQQRVALARALAYSPGVLLLDEPFSNLDAKLRERARAWMKHLQHELRLTTIFVTHDQDEALEMSDRVILMDGGRILRDGSPEGVYRDPQRRFVAEFLGQCTFLAGVCETNADGTAVLRTNEFPDGIVVAGKPRPGLTKATVAVRPEDVVLHPADAARGMPSAHVIDVSFFGDHYQCRLMIGGCELLANTPARPASRVVGVEVLPGRATFIQ